MKQFAFILVWLVAAGCATPLAEINYHGPLLASESDAFAASERFARALEKETDLKIVDRSKRTDIPRIDASASVHLRTRRTSDVWVIVIAYVDQKEINVRVAGDIGSPVARELAAACERVYALFYPGREFVQVQRNRGILGP